LKDTPIEKMKKWIARLSAIALLLLTACQPKTPACQWATGTPRYLTDLPPDNLSTQRLSKTTPVPLTMEIGGRKISVDKIVEGPLCNDTWSGTVYVTCNVQVYSWTEQPLFLKNCNPKIAPGTVVYVAYHNNTAYYNGCSCHIEPTINP
jgi:hypothetical protein